MDLTTSNQERLIHKLFKLIKSASNANNININIDNNNNLNDNSIFLKVTQKPQSNFKLEIAESSLILIGIMAGITALLI